MGRLLRASLLGSVIVAASWLQSCGGGKNNPSNQSRVISFWHFWSEPRQEAALKSAIARYQSAHPGDSVVLTALSWGEGKTKLLAAFNSGVVPDVVELGSDWVAQFSSGGVLVDLGPADSLARTRFGEALSPGVWNDRVFAAPWVIDTRVLFYNKDLFVRAGLDSSVPPSTWAGLQHDCEKIAALGGGVFGFGANAADAHRVYKKILPFFWANGGEILSPDGTRCVVNSERNVEALTAYLHLTSAGMLETQKQLDAQFAHGALGVWLSGAWLIDKIKSERPDLHYGVALMPRPAADAGSPTSFAGGEYLAVTRAGKSSAAATEFVTYMSNGANAAEFCASLPEAGYPADVAFRRDPRVVAGLHRSVFADQLEHARFTPVHPQWLDIEKIIEDEVVEAMYGRKTAEEALSAAQSEIEEILPAQ